MVKNWTTHSTDETKALAERLGNVLIAPVTIALVGDLGAGKTCFAQGLARSLHLEDQPVSPTFILISEHEGQIPLLHSDLYRVEEADLVQLGIEEQLEEWPGVCIVEWANRFPSVLPTRTIWVSLHHRGEKREIKAWSDNPKLLSVIDSWSKS